MAIGWADQKHDWIEQAAGAGKVRTASLPRLRKPSTVGWLNSANGMEDRPIAVALEQSRGPLLFQLLKYSNLVLFTIHPDTVAHYRKGFRPSGAKSDSIDRAVLLDLLLRHRDQLLPLNPDTVETRLLQFLTEKRRQWVNDRTRLDQRLTA